VRLLRSVNGRSSTEHECAVKASAVGIGVVRSSSTDWCATIGKSARAIIVVAQPDIVVDDIQTDGAYRLRLAVETSANYTDNSVIAFSRRHQLKSNRFHDSRGCSYTSSFKETLSC
jgi:hypothetical protein